MKVKDIKEGSFDKWIPLGNVPKGEVRVIATYRDLEEGEEITIVYAEGYHITKDRIKRINLDLQTILNYKSRKNKEKDIGH